MSSPVVLVRTDVSEERIASIIMMTRHGLLATTLAVTNNRRTLQASTVLLKFRHCRSTWSGLLYLDITCTLDRQQAVRVS
jgi:hypothetical protein